MVISRLFFSVLTLMVWSKAMVASSELDYYPIYLFNEGTVETGKSCTTQEWQLVQDTMGMAYGRRRLKGSAVSDPHRNLRRCSNCGGKPLCIGFAGIGCAVNPNRRLGEVEGDTTILSGAEARDLQTSPCGSTIANIDAALNTLQPQVSPSCQALIGATRSVTCAQYTRDCDIFGFSLLNFGDGAVIKKIEPNGTSVCAYDLVNIRADSNFFLGSVTLRLTGPAGRKSVVRTYVETSIPYTIFGRTDYPGFFEIPPFVQGKMLSAGVYNIRAFSEDDPAAGRNATFTVTSSCS